MDCARRLADDAARRRDRAEKCSPWLGTLRKPTIGNTGTAGVLISPTAKGAARAYHQEAVVATAGEPVLSTGDATAHVRLGRYQITEFSTTRTTGGRWTMAYVLCNGHLVGGAQGRITVTLTASNPKRDCIFVNRFTTDVPTTGLSGPHPHPDPARRPEPDAASGAQR